MGNDEAWAMPRRTMSNPSSLRAARRLCIPAGIDDLVTCSKEVILQERMTPPQKFPSWPAAPASANTAAATAAAAPRPVAEAAADTEAAATAAAVSEDGDSNDQVLTVDDILYYTPSEFAALRKKAAASAKVLEWQRACFPDSIVSLTSTPQRIKLGEALGEALGSAAPTPAGARASSRKKYFEHSELHHKVIAVLNKVSSDAQKYAEVRNELHRLPLPSSDEQFDKVVGVFFTKAVQEPHFSDQYAQLVVELVNSPGRATGAEDQSFAVRFKKALVDRCQAEYTRSCDLLQTANRDDSEDIAECKVRLRGTLNFVAHLYMQHMLPSRVVVEILKELTYEPPSDGHIDGVIAILKACAPQLVQEEPDWLARVMQVCRSYANDQSVPLVKRIRFLCLDAADLIEKQLPPDVPISSNGDVVDDGEYVDDGTLVPVPFAADVVDRMDDYVKRARTIMADLAQTDDYERALTRVLQEPDQYAVMLGWIHRAATTPRAEKERQQLPYFMRFLVERKVFDLESARHIFREWARVAVQTREWENSLLMWKAWSQILSEDKERDGIATQDLHNYVLHNVIVSPCARLPDDIDHYVEAVLKVNHDRTWDIKIESASKAHRFRYLAHLIGCCGHERIGDVPLSTVRKVGLPIDDVEARVFVDLMERRSPWEFIRGHEHAQSLAMVQKVMGAILAAAVALQDDHLATGSMDLLQLVVDGPDRALREALIITELMGSGAIMETHMRSPAFGYQLSKALKECEVISEATMMQAHERYGRDPLAIQLIGPCVGPPFVSQPALTVGVSSSAKRDQAIPNVNRKLLR